MRACVIQFLKSPEFVPVKTRMRAYLSDAQCRRLHCQLAKHVALSLTSDDDTLCYQLCSSHGGQFAQRLARDLSCQHSVQREGDLGLRLFSALCHALNSAETAIVLGSDCPFIDRHYLERALSALATHDMVIGPATDGGYVLLGLRRGAVHAALFEEITWGGDQVFKQTIVKAERLGLSYEVLPELSDIDRPEDLGLLNEPRLQHLLIGVSEA